MDNLDPRLCVMGTKELLELVERRASEYLHMANDEDCCEHVDPDIYELCAAFMELHLRMCSGEPSPEQWTQSVTEMDDE